MSHEKKYRFLLVQPFRIPTDSKHLTWVVEGTKEEKLMNYNNLNLGRLLEDVEWEIHPGPLAPYGDWPVENREEFCLVAAARLPIIKEACESKNYNAIVLLGGGEPGLYECKEIGKRYGIPVTSCAWSQMLVACMLGNKFSVIDLAESHSSYYYNLVVQHHMASRCASIRNINYPLGRPGVKQERSLPDEKAKALRGEFSQGVEDAVNAAIAAIQEDGAEVITFGCSGTFWLQSFVKEKLQEMGWDIPVLEGYACAIEVAKLMVNLGVDASGLWFPADHPKQWRAKKVF
jgi:allantoin racemase